MNLNIISNWHPTLVHFAAGLLFAASLMFLLSCIKFIANKKQNLIFAARVNLWLGTIILVVTSILSLYSMYDLHSDLGFYRVLNLHLNLVVLNNSLILILAIWSIIYQVQNKKTSSAFVVCMLIVSILFGINIFQGRSLICNHLDAKKTQPSATKTMTKTIENKKTTRSRFPRNMYKRDTK